MYSDRLTYSWPRGLIVATIPSGLTRAIVGLSDLFSKRAWPLVQVLLTGAILAVGARTVSAVLRVMGLSQERQFQKYHRILNRVKWSTLAASRHLLVLLTEAFVPTGPLLMALDDTIERRRGARISAKGIYRDPVRSSHGHFVKASGLRWLCLMLIAPIPWAKRCWALPFCSVLAPSERSPATWTTSQQADRPCPAVVVDGQALGGGASHRGRRRQQFRGVGTAWRGAPKALHRHPFAARRRPVRPGARTSTRRAWTASPQGTATADAESDIGPRHHPLAQRDAVPMV